VTAARSLLIAVVAVALISARPGAEAQFPRGLMASPPADKAPAFCAIETRPLSFGIYDPAANADLDALAQVIYICNNQANKIRVEMTTGYANQFDRLMSSGEDTLSYNIYLDATHQTIWGQGAFGTDVYYQSNPPNGTPVTVLGYGRIRAGQGVTPGNYADALTVRILF
jgi:spore coat protein U-like protein